jgi:hypothetical protein
VDAATARREAGLGQLDPASAGGVGLVLGAGNITSIPYLDVLYELLASNRVAILKVNPTQDALVPSSSARWHRSSSPDSCGSSAAAATSAPISLSIRRSTTSTSRGRRRRSAPSCGARRTPPPPVPPRRRRDGRPLLKKPITAELGGVSPIIIVPGRWSNADLRFQAEHVVTMRLHNSGHNCIAGQVVLLSDDWPQRDAFLDELRAAYDRAPSRPVWYPQSQGKLDAARTSYPDAAWCGGGTRALVEASPTDAGASRRRSTSRRFSGWWPCAERARSSSTAPWRTPTTASWAPSAPTC